MRRYCSFYKCRTSHLINWLQISHIPISQIPQSIRQISHSAPVYDRNFHAFNNDALWNVGHLHCGIFSTDLYSVAVQWSTSISLVFDNSSTLNCAHKPNPFCAYCSKACKQNRATRVITYIHMTTPYSVWESVCDFRQSVRSILHVNPVV